MDVENVSPVEFLENALTRAELWAIEASRENERFVPTGAHWHWECNTHDFEADLDPGTGEFLGTGRCECFTFSLRSREKFDTGSVGKLPIFAINTAEEIPVATAVHIVNNDPAVVMRRVSKARLLMREHEVRDGRCRVCTAHANSGWTRFKYPCPTIFLLAESWGWEGEWKLD